MSAEKQKIRNQDSHQTSVMSELVVKLDETTGGTSRLDSLELYWDTVAVELQGREFADVATVKEAVISALLTHCGIPPELEGEGRILMESMIEGSREIADILQNLVKK